LPSTSESLESAAIDAAHAAAPREAAASRSACIDARDVWVRFRLQTHRHEATLRESFVRLLHPARWRNPAASEFWALRGVSLHAQPGDVIGILGRNGSGKTTLLKTLAGIYGPDRGACTVRGRVGCLLSFGVGFQHALSGRENIFLNGSILGLSQREIARRNDEILAFSELEQFIDAPVRTYSAGMRGRLGFSIAVHIDPDVLVLDEVLATGDAAFRAKTGTILERLRGEHKIIVIASHSMDVICESCTRALWLDAGQIRMDGAPADVTKAYLVAAEAPPART
jgi:ABC-type polysaccharide/polyol phosphate transport system ATPase subunit